jgi:hypothetical protein
MLWERVSPRTSPTLLMLISCSQQEVPREGDIWVARRSPGMQLPLYILALSILLCSFQIGAPTAFASLGYSSFYRSNA